MDTEKLRVFLQVVKDGTISGTAERLGYTTSGISRLVASLEEDAGFPLLKRYHSGVKPTGECRMLLPVMEELVREEEKYHQLTAQLRGLETGTITVGTAYSGYYRTLAGLIAGFTKKYPGIRVQVIEGTSSQLVEQVGNQSVDFCIISRRPGSFRWIPLEQDELVALVAHDHPATSGCAFVPGRFSTEPFIELYPDCETDNSMFFQRTGIRPDTRFSTYDVNAGVAMVEAGLGVTLTNRLWAKSLSSHVAVLPLDPPEKIDIGIATPPKSSMSPAAKMFSVFAEKELLP